MYKLSAFLNVLQVLLLVHVYCQMEPIEDGSVSSTINFVLLVHVGVLISMLFLTMRARTISPNVIGLSLFLFAGSMSLFFISRIHLQKSILYRCSIALTMCGFCSLSTCWWSVYQEKFQNYW